jgi:hypothetical protein
VADPRAPGPPGLDRSWQVALHLAAAMDLRQGVDLVFTYGPLGFLSVPQPYLGGTSLLALLACAGVYFGLVAVLLVEARRVLPLWAAAVVVLAIARSFALLEPSEAFQALVFVICLEALAGRVRLPTLTTVALIGVAAGLGALGKLNVGIFVAAMGFATAVTIDRRWWRGAAIFIVSAAATALVLWVATGQWLTDLPSYVSGAFQIVNGYPDAMSLDDPASYWIFPAFLGTAALLAWTCYRLGADWPPRRRIGLALLSVILGFAMWKTATVRPGPAYTFATFLIAASVLGAGLRDRRWWLTSLLAVGVAFAASSRLVPVSYLDVVSSARAAIGETVTALVPSAAQAATGRNRAALRSRYALDPTTLGELAGHRVHIDPNDTSVAFAYPEFTWAPLPVFQSYSAYTPALDRLNAARLASSDAPDRILRGVTFDRDPTDWLTRQRGHPLLPGESIPIVVDGRFRWFEQPAATLETFCRYRELSAIGAWQVLGRTGGSCGPGEPLATVTAREGVVVNVPVEIRPGRFVTVRIRGLEPSLLGRLRAAAFKPQEWDVTIAGVRYRLVAPTASDGLLLAVPPVADGSGDFAFGPPIESLSVESSQNGKRLLTYEFESVPLLGP